MAQQLAALQLVLEDRKALLLVLFPSLGVRALLKQHLVVVAIQVASEHSGALLIGGRVFGVHADADATRVCIVQNALVQVIGKIVGHRLPASVLKVYKRDFLIIL